MSSIKGSRARATTDLAAGHALAGVEIAASPERVFRALASKEVVDWWVRPGVFDTTEWTGDVRVGGRWRASGVGRGRPYVLEGEFLEVDPPRKLVHTWHPVGTPGAPTTVTYLLELLDGGTRITLRHVGFTAPEACTNTAIGWETSFERLAEVLAREKERAMTNPVVHWEVLGKDAPKLQKFYAQLFGWTINADNPMKYGLVETGGEGINGGIGPAEDSPALVTFYVRVDDLKAYLAKAERLGGKTVVPPTEIPGMVTFALFADPEGNRVGLVKG